MSPIKIENKTRQSIAKKNREICKIKPFFPDQLGCCVYSRCSLN